MAFTPKIPTFHRAKGRDGKERLYLIASNRVDIELIMQACGCFQEGVRYQKDKDSDLWFRIIKKHEEKVVRKVFDIGKE